MYKFGKKSKERLATCHQDLQDIMNDLIEIMDVTILCGHRTEEAQNKAFNDGFSKLKYPHSKHNQLPSMAVDVAPYPVDWNDTFSFQRMCGIIEGIAHKRGIKIRLGRDFSFNDMPHIELI